MRVPRAVARFNRHITNPLALALGGWAPTVGSLEHVGRKSGKRYRTAGGTATIHKHGKTVQVTDPRIVSKAEAAPLVTSARILYRVHPYDEAALVVTAR